MSALEVGVKPVLASLLQDISVQLDEQQQTQIALWAVKTAFVLEATKPRAAHRFYTQSEREAFKSDSLIPPLTRVWLGRYEASGLFAAAVDVKYDIKRLNTMGFGAISTIIVGHAVLQVLGLKFPLPSDTRFGIPLRNGNWESLLFPIWPIERTVLWPPPASFQAGSGFGSLPELHQRWAGESPQKSGAKAG